jgi:hypothetical protein
MKLRFGARVGDWRTAPSSVPPLEIGRFAPSLPQAVSLRSAFAPHRSGCHRGSCRCLLPRSLCWPFSSGLSTMRSISGVGSLGAVEAIGAGTVENWNGFFDRLNFGSLLQISCSNRWGRLPGKGAAAGLKWPMISPVRLADKRFCVAQSRVLKANQGKSRLENFSWTGGVANRPGSAPNAIRLH